jgi:hypothetical protein
MLVIRSAATLSLAKWSEVEGRRAKDEERISAAFALTVANVTSNE